MLNEYKNINSKLSKKTKLDINKATFFSLISIILDSVSIVLIVPILTAIISPEYIQEILENFNLAKLVANKNLALMFSIAYIVSFVLANIYRIWCSNYVLKITKSYKVDLIYKFAKSLLSNNQFREEKKTEAYYTNLITKEVDLHTQYAFTEIINIKRDITLVFIAFLVGIYNFGAYLFLAFPLLMPLLFIIKKLNKIRIKKIAKQRQIAEYFKFKSIKEFFYLFVDIYVKKKGENFISIISRETKNLLDIERRQTLYRQSLKPIAEIYIAIVLLIIFILLANSNTFSKEIQLSYMVYVMILVTKILPSINKIQQSFYNLSFIANTTKNIYSTVENFNNPKNKINDDLKNKLIFKDIKIKNGNTFLLSVDNFEVNLGDVIRISGKSGSGKSSIFNLILGLNKPLTGEISALGYSVHYLNNSLLEKVGYVAQETRLFNGSLAENVSFGVEKELIDTKKVNKILEKVGLKYLVEREKAGIWQEIVSENFQLSGGERQKIGIARALYDEPKLLLLDEITTSLDSASRDEIYNLIEKISSTNDRIILFISHEVTVPIDYDYEIKIENAKARFNSYCG